MEVFGVNEGFIIAQLINLTLLFTPIFFIVFLAIKYFKNKSNILD